MTELTPVGEVRPIIPALPEPLRLVPSWLDGPRDSDAWRRESGWDGWAENLKDFRVWVTRKARADSAFRQAQMKEAAADPAYFLSVFGWIFEPRDTDLGDPGWYQWCLFPHQVIALRQLQEAFRTKKPRSDVVWEKSRDMGATWLAMGFCLHQWLFAPAFTAGLVSFREDAVDNGTPDSMFFKLRGLLGKMEYGESPGVPDWMQPDGYVKEIHGRRLKLNHPSKMCVIVGESTTARGGTGARNTLRVNDEGAKHDQLKENLASQRAVTNHILTLSSAYRGYGRDFENLAIRARAAEDALAQGEPERDRGPRYFRMEYWMHPHHDEAWRTNEEEGYESKESFAREVLIDYTADAELIIYGEEAAKIPLTDAGDEPEHPLYVGIDPGLKDPTAIVFATAWGDPYNPEVRWLDSFEMAGRPTQYFAHILTGIHPQPGDVCYDMYREDFSRQDVSDLMEWMLRNWLARRRVTVVMDPAGAQATMAAMSLSTPKTQGHIFPEQLDRYAYFLRERYRQQALDAAPEDQREKLADELPEPSFFPVRWRHLYSMNRFDPRQSNLRAILAKSEIRKNRGGYRMLEVLKESTYQKRLTSAQATTEAKAVHDEYSHIRTGMEFLASHLRSAQSGLGLAASNRRKASGRRAASPRRKAA